MCFGGGSSSGGSSGGDSGGGSDDNKSATTVAKAPAPAPAPAPAKTKADIQKEINQKIKDATDSSGNVNWVKADVGALVKQREAFDTASKPAAPAPAAPANAAPSNDAKAKRAAAIAAKTAKIKAGTVAEGKGTGDYKTVGDIVSDPIGFYTDTKKKVVDGVTADLTMGLKTFGLSKEKQAEKLRELGYSEKAIISYQERTEATKKRMAEEAAAKSSDDGVGTAIIPTTAPTTPTGPTPTPAPPPTTGTEAETDIDGAGDTSLTPEDIMTQDPDTALSNQERLAARELRRQRQLRALSKAERLRSRIETQNRGRRSLIRGAFGGAGFRSGY